MTKALIEGFFLGISTGSLCLMTCTPIYLPYIMTSNKKLSKSLLAVAEISIGRFISYLTFGALAGLAGTSISSVDRNFYGAIANILLSVYLVLTVLRSHRSDKKCHVPKALSVTKSGLLLGILTGINFCPAFLIALNQAVNIGGMLSGVLIFLGFFSGTTLYLIPLAFASLLNQIKKMKYVARILSLIVAIWFMSKGISTLVNHFEMAHQSETRIIDVFHPANHIIVVSDIDNLPYFLRLKDALIIAKNQPVSIYSNYLSIPDSAYKENSIFFLDSSLKPLSKILEHDVISIEAGYEISAMTNWLQKFTFQTDDPLFWEFKNQNVTP